MKILITGPQGSGKTTQAEIISRKYNLPIIKLGDLIRAKAADGSAEGNILKKAMESGELADDSLVAELLRQKLVEPQYEKGFVIDGYPRRLSQIEEFDPEVDIAFDLEISDEVAEKRLLKRGRADDTPDLIEQRLHDFHRLTEEVIEFYQKEGILIRINGELGVEEVTKDIEEHLQKIW